MDLEQSSSLSLSGSSSPWFWSVACWAFCLGREALLAASSSPTILGEPAGALVPQQVGPVEEAELKTGVCASLRGCRGPESSARERPD